MNLLEQRLRERFGKDDANVILSIIDSLCQYCWDHDTTTDGLCYCTRDD
jgi:hypothetical protein